ncbi:MAG TPA: glycosyltransferase family 4 protein [Geminicoccaceae bacterium]|nr:glycosyltransferase family 4 protein [Geminicoccaceae bacterium]
MRILMLLHDAYGGRRGIAKYNRDFIEACCNHPAIEQVIVLPRRIAEPVAGVPERCAFRIASAGGSAAYARELLGVLTPWPNYDLVVCGHINLLPPACLAAFLSHAPLALIMHGIEAWQPARRALSNRLVGRIDRFLAVSEVTRERFAAWSGVGADRIDLLPNCIDLRRFARGPARSDLLARYGLAGRRVLLTLGGLAASERYKGIDEVLEVLPQLAQAMPAVAYLVAGDGDDRARLEAKAAALGVADRVVFAGYVAEEEKADHYRLADAFAMPSRGEGFGIVFLEAMACGVPVLGGLLDGGREAVRCSGELGVLCDPRDPDDVLRGLHELLGRPKGIVPAGLAEYSAERFAQRVHRWLHGYAAAEPVRRSA